MHCSLCNSTKVKTIYSGKIRDGRLGHYTEEDVPMYQCEDCGVIWHEDRHSDIGSYYESKEYRLSLEGGVDEERFYKLHDKETLDKLTYTGTDIFRGKAVADVGCGAGSFLDFVAGVAREVVAIEPSQPYREILRQKDYSVYAYANDALGEYRKGIDVVTSFDVIEHVADPRLFLSGIYDLLAPDGQAIIGTPTDAPVMRSLLGEIYEKKLLFSTQHLWIFSERNLRLLAEEQGFGTIGFQYFQRYGIGNMIGWVRDKMPGTSVDGGFISAALDGAWRGHLSDNKIADYIVMYLRK